MNLQNHEQSTHKIRMVIDTGGWEENVHGLSWFTKSYQIICPILLEEYFHF